MTKFDQMGRAMFEVENCDAHNQSGDRLKEMAKSMRDVTSAPFSINCPECSHGFGYNSEGNLFESYALDGKWHKSQMDIIEAQLRNEGIII